MPRPPKHRRVCALPKSRSFGPDDCSGSEDTAVSMGLDEYETLRLIDLLGYTQDECAGQMGVARTTVQAVYNCARKKLADMLVNGKRLVIEGGNYELCGIAQSCCGRGAGGCRRRSCQADDHIIRRGDVPMKFAVTYENGQVFQHFGHTEQFKVYETENGKIVSQKIIDADGAGHGALAGFLKDNGVDVLICGGIGGGARSALAEAGIELYPGASGSADEQAEAFIRGELQYDPDTQCSHHDHEHHEGHDGHCGGHCGH